MGKDKSLRLEALKRFAIAITVLNIAGHSFLGFESSWGHLLFAIATTYLLELIFEWTDSMINHTRPRFKGGFAKLVHFLLPAHITAMAVLMLLFTNQKVWPVVFASAVAISSKILFCVKVHNKKRHFLNPSNTGIAATLILFPWTAIAPPYEFTESTTGVVDRVLPLVFIAIGSFLNLKFTKRMPLILEWFFGFVMQGVMGSKLTGSHWEAAVYPMTGVAFLLFSFYMISNPATTPSSKAGQVIFGMSVAFAYGVLVYLNVVFGLFFCFIDSLFILWNINGQCNLKI